ncbi:hypothetical protein K1T35_17545 [Pseudonocardia sp. DSM 110487]|uniref:hypothetical protein n=1 Tax=Pseudonocardia sp. DSM 110487 TaxID=2865833 RepID=UPI001C69E305|nr:hypothetical protein [Pseudonocardia sp. DSM 110487]QYN38845.1 hypothetical protein K1T35_17545 [Pseudonocardia sp. DSM 110487]
MTTEHVEIGPAPRTPPGGQPRARAATAAAEQKLVGVQPESLVPTVRGPRI